MFLDEDKVKKYSSKGVFSHAAQAFSGSGSERPFAPLNIAEKWRIFKGTGLYKAILVATVCIVGIGFYLGQKPDVSKSAQALKFTPSTTTIKKAASKKIIVFITGQVNEPGVVELEEGKRLFEAIDLAGGATSLADISKCDLAGKVIDGATFYIPKVEENTSCARALSAVGGVSATGGGSSGTLVNLNTATQTELEALPGIGPSLAQTILSYREENGGFSSVNDLRKVNGIGDKKFSDIKDLVSV